MAEMIQGTAEWFDARLGKATASRVVDIVTRLKSGKFSADRERYMVQLLAERLTGQAVEHFVSRDMMWGTEQEPAARAQYQFDMGIRVVQVGFVPHPAIADAGASPDGLVGPDGLIEIKAPTTTTHIATWERGTAPEDYVPQMQWQMACTNRNWCDFVSYDPRMPDHLKLFVRRVPRDQAAIDAMEADVVAFLAELRARLDKLDALAAPADAQAA